MNGKKDSPVTVISNDDLDVEIRIPVRTITGNALFGKAMFNTITGIDEQNQINLVHMQLLRLKDDLNN